MTTEDPDKLISLAVDRPIWDRVFGVFPLVIVGSKEDDGRYNLAPKHLAMPMSWENHFGFVCSPGHTTYHNIRRHGAFTVSYPRLSEVLLASLAAAPRCEDRSKPSLLVLPTFPAGRVDGVLVQAAAERSQPRLLANEPSLPRLRTDLGRRIAARSRMPLRGTPRR